MQILPINTTNNNLNKTKCSNNFKAKMIVSSASNFYHPKSRINASYAKLLHDEKEQVVRLVNELSNMAKNKEIFAYFPRWFTNSSGWYL